MVGAAVGMTAALLLAYTVIGALHLDSDLATAPVFLPLVIALIGLSQRWVLNYRVRRSGRWLLVNVLSLASLIPLVWSFQRCLGMECFINIGHMSALIWVGSAICLLQWLLFQQHRSWAAAWLVIAMAGGVAVGLTAGPKPTGLLEMVLIGVLPAIIAAFWSAWLLTYPASGRPVAP